MRYVRVKGVVLWGTALCMAGCVMSANPTGPVGLASKTVSTVAGQTGVAGANPPASSSSGVAASAAQFWYPAGMVYVASTNSIYIADSANSAIRQWNLSTNQVTTFAGVPGYASYFDNINDTNLAAYFNQPEGITTDTTNTYLYVADSGNNAIRRIKISSGVVDTLAGNPFFPPGWLDATGAGARFNNPLGICYDNTGGGSLYVADSGNSAIRYITNLGTNTGVVTTIAGSPTSTTFWWPQGIVFDSVNGLFYVVDSGYDEVFSVTTGGVVTAVAGSGARGDADGTGAAAQFNWPEGIATDNTNLYIADTLNSVIREVAISTGAVTTLAGQGQVTGSSDGAGNVATFNHPMRVLVNGTTIYVSDTYNETIREIQ